MANAQKRSYLCVIMVLYVFCTLHPPESQTWVQYESKKGPFFRQNARLVLTYRQTAGISVYATIS